MTDSGSARVFEIQICKQQLTLALRIPLPHVHVDLLQLSLKLARLFETQKTALGEDLASVCAPQHS